MGLNSVRVWLSYASYEEEPKETVDRLGELIELCGEHGLTIMPILFDSCGVEPEIFRAKGETAEPHWRRWMPNPGYSRLGEEHWPELDRYVEDIVGPHLQSAPVLAWNIMNEPWAAKIRGNPEQKRTAEKFVRHYFGLVRELKLEAPLTFSATFFDHCATLEDEVDVICYYSSRPTWRDGRG